MEKGKLNITIGGQWGSEAKGKLSLYLTLKHDVNLAVCDFQTNAGHTVVVDKDKYVFQQLPVSAVKQDCELLINPGATVTVPKLLEEVDTHNCEDRLTIHPHVAIVTEKARMMEAEMLKRIASTLKGVGATLDMKAMRHPELVLAKDVPELKPFIGDTTEILHRYLKSKAVILAEGAQGFDLSINHGWQYPYVTSRDVTTASILSNAGVSPKLVGTVYGCIRTFPIRVGNHVENGKLMGTSGPYYPDHMEVDWEYVQKFSGSTDDQTEKTTVTQKIRRVFTYSREQVRRFIQVCAPDHLFVNFVNHLDCTSYGVRTWGELSDKVKEFLMMVSRDCDVSHVGTGPDNQDMVDIEL